MGEYICEKCGADMRTEHDPEGIGNLRDRHGWVCDDCACEIDNGEDDDE